MAEERDDFFDVDEPLEDALARGDDLEADGITPKPMATRCKVYGALSESDFKRFVLLRLRDMRLHGFNRFEMAREFGKSLRTIDRWLRKLDDLMAEEARMVEPFVILGDTKSRYDNLEATAWSFVNNSNLEPKDRIAAAKLVATINKDRMAMLAEYRFSDDKKIIPVGVNRVSGAASAKRLIEDMSKLLTSAALMSPRNEIIDAEYTETESDPD